MELPAEEDIMALAEDLAARCGCRNIQAHYGVARAMIEVRDEQEARNAH